MKHTITETKIRSIIRKELESYLIQEGLWDRISSDYEAIKTNFKTGLQQVKDSWTTPAKPSSEYIEIKKILDELKIPSTSLQKVYDLLFTKNEQQQYKYVTDSAVIGTEIQQIKKIQDILKPILETAIDKEQQKGNVIPTPMQEGGLKIKQQTSRQAKRAEDRLAATQIVKARQEQEKEQKNVNTAQTQINTLYDDIKTSYENNKQNNNTTGILVSSISLFVGQIANIIIKEKNLIQNQIDLINKLFNLLLNDLEKLKSQPATTTSAPAETSA